MAESEIVASLQQVLPEQFQQLIPSELRNVAPQSPAVAQQQAQEAFYEEPPLSAEQLSISQSGMQLHLQVLQYILERRQKSCRTHVLFECCVINCPTMQSSGQCLPWCTVGLLGSSHRS